MGLDAKAAHITNSNQINNQMGLAVQVTERIANKITAGVKGNSIVTVVEDGNNHMVDKAGAVRTKSDLSCHSGDVKP